ncbi:MAG TPA: DUF1569 domain-containing protein [Phycisphaerales bacterium]|nr:DUF1569 domain-containing protein [Phycisphaerales bacterium]
MSTGVASAAQSEFRQVHFDTLEDLLAEIDTLVAADHAGTLRATGNWTPGQIFGHLAAWIEYSYEGYPSEMQPPWFVRMIARMMKRRFLSKPMRRGFRIPGIAAGTYGTELMSTEAGAARLRSAIARLQCHEPARFHSPALGKMTDEERIAVSLRHAEVHLGYLIP